MHRPYKFSLVVSSRGKVILPVPLRKKLGLLDGGVVIVEERDGIFVLKPAAIVELDMYTDEQIAEWKQNDLMSENE